LHKLTTSPTMPPMRTTLLMLALALVACGGDDNPAVDAPPPIDAAIDAPPRPVLQNTPQVYCDTIQAACTGANAQYPNANQCLATAVAFAPGANASEMTGNTLGCRIYHAQNAMITGDVVTHCPHAGPGGNKIDLTVGQCGTPCESFCDLNVAVCGTDANALAANHYDNRDACIAACNGFTKTPLYTAPAPAGNTFACRLYHLTNAALFKNQATPDPTMHNFHCGHTLSPAVGTPAVCI
jgi:hypothetical protein